MPSLTPLPLYLRPSCVLATADRDAFPATPGGLGQATAQALRRCVEDLAAQRYGLGAAPWGLWVAVADCIGLRPSALSRALSATHPQGAQILELAARLGQLQATAAGGYWKVSIRVQDEDLQKVWSHLEA